MDNALLDIGLKSAMQQPTWEDQGQVERVHTELAERPALVCPQDLDTLRGLLARVAVGGACVVQTGDCAEDPDECAPAHVARKAALLDMLAGSMKMITHKPVVRAGRIAGQFGKPRSSDFEKVGGLELPVYRGHMVNGPDPDSESRRPDPLRLLTGYMAAREVMGRLGWLSIRRAPIDPPVWTSHEALLLDYELPMLRRDESGQLFLSSTHWPWIGERTRQVDGAHVALLAEVSNPVACKVGPGMDSDEILTLCERLDPNRQAGRLTLIARMGAKKVSERLPALVSTVRAAGHPVIWLTDPMHGNTVATPDGVKTRCLTTIQREIRGFQDAIESAGGIAGGVHLETTPDDVRECVADELCAENGRTGTYTSFCDPRLSPDQALSVISAWRP